MIIKKCDEQYIDKTGIFYEEVVQDLMNNINYPLWNEEYPNKEFVKYKTSINELYICIEDEEVVAAFVLNTDPDGSYEKGNWKQDLKLGEYLIIHTLAIKTSMQGKGLGKYIIEWCKEYTKDHGYKGIRLDVVPTNTPAIKLYKKNGFEFAGEVDLDRNIERIPTFVLYGWDVCKD